MAAKTTPHSWPAAIVNVLLPGAEPVGDSSAAKADWQPDPPHVYCHRCGATAGHGAATTTGCPHCRDRPIHWQHLYRLGPYSDPLNDWIKRMKFHGSWGWAAWFGQQLARSIPPLDHHIVTPVPLHWTRRWSRGFDQSMLIARSLAKARGATCVNLLTRRRRTSAQSHLKARQHRLDNVKGAFAIKPVDLHGWTVLLVDDVITSGATAGQCAKLLHQAGAQVHLAVVAVADVHGADFQHV